MNVLLLGTGDHTRALLDNAQPPFLLIDDGPADVFVEKFNARVFDPHLHSFNPLRGIDYKRARDLVTTLYSSSPEGENTLTVRNGKRALMRMVLKAPRLDKLPKPTTDAEQEAHDFVKDILLSPVLERVLCNPTDFRFKGNIVLKLDRTQLHERDAFILGNLLIGHYQGHIIVPDYGFYASHQHRSLMRQNRLVAGVNFLAELPPKLQQAVLLFDQKIGNHCTWEDATALAQYAGLVPGTVEHTEFIQGAMA